MTDKKKKNLPVGVSLPTPEAVMEGLQAAIDAAVTATHDGAVVMLRAIGGISEAGGRIDIAGRLGQGYVLGQRRQIAAHGEWLALLDEIGTNHRRAGELIRLAEIFMPDGKVPTVGTLDKLRNLGWYKTRECLKLTESEASEFLDGREVRGVNIGKAAKMSRDQLRLAFADGGNVADDKREATIQHLKGKVQSLKQDLRDRDAVIKEQRQTSEGEELEFDYISRLMAPALLDIEGLGGRLRLFVREMDKNATEQGARSAVEKKARAGAALFFLQEFDATKRKMLAELRQIEKEMRVQAGQQADELDFAAAEADSDEG